MYDVIIIGGGPAGTAAGVYAARKQLRTLLIAEEMGGQSVVSLDIQNWIGTTTISGPDLATSFKKHLEVYAGTALDLKTGERVTEIHRSSDTFIVTTEAGTYEAHAVLIATGARRRKLSIPGAAEFENKGVVYCASCDGPLFSGKDVTVIGGGNAGFETAAQLLAYTTSVTLLQHSNVFKADAITVEKVLANPKMKAILNAEPKEIIGDAFVSALVYTDATTGNDIKIPTEGVFVEIGLIPNTDYAKGLVDFDDYNRIIIDPWTQRTSIEGVWAAGDCSNIKYHQNNIAAGDAVKALEDIYLWLHARS